MPSKFSFPLNLMRLGSLEGDYFVGMSYTSAVNLKELTVSCSNHYFPAQITTFLLKSPKSTKLFSCSNHRDYFSAQITKATYFPAQNTEFTLLLKFMNSKSPTHMSLRFTPQIIGMCKTSNLLSQEQVRTTSSRKL